MLIKQKADNYYNAYIKQQTNRKYTIRKRKIMLTYQVTRAWIWLHIEYKDIIIIVFRSVRMSLNLNRLKDRELKIKALDKITIRDQHQLDISQTKEQDKVIAQIALEVEEACQNGTI